MAQRRIQEIALDQAGHLRVRPELLPGDDYSFVYRDASGVTWIPEVKAFAAREPHRWEPLELFRQILHAVRNEYGHHLMVSAKTQWTNVPADLRADIGGLPNSG